MMSDDTNARSPEQAPLAALRRFVRPRAAVEMCDLCSIGLAPEHQHLIDPAPRQLLCACAPGALLFSTQAQTKSRGVPRRIRALPGFQLSDAQWEDQQVP